MKIGLYVMNEKGLAVAMEAMTSGLAIAHVTTAEARGLDDESHKEISAQAKHRGIPSFLLSHPPEFTGDISIAAGWRWMLDVPYLVVLHDSLLPKYRGHAPLVTALINGEREVGVSAFMARDEPDTGPIITQRSMPVTYPVRMREVLDRIVLLYQEIAHEICQTLVRGEALRYVEQDHTQATYSVWRDEEDYRIDWSQPSWRIRDLINAVSDPFPGAWTVLCADGHHIRVLEAETVADLRIEDRRPGKVMRREDGDALVVVCGQGLLKIRVEHGGPFTQGWKMPSRVRFE